MIKIGNNDLTIKLGNSEIPAIYCGDVQIYPDTGTTPDTGSSQYALPAVDYLLNFNSKEYDDFGAGWNIIPDEYNVLPNYYDPVYISFLDFGDGTDPVWNGDYITVSPGQHINFIFNNTGSNPFNIEQNNRMTVVFKAKTTSGENIVANRSDTSMDGSNNGGTYNYMVRQKSSYYTIHFSSEGYANTQATCGSTEIMSFVFDNGVANGYNWTTSTSGATDSFYAQGGSSRFGLFTGNYYGEDWGGDFYWIYVSPTALTDAQIQEVIDYNENL